MIRITRQGRLTTATQQTAHHYSIGGHRVVFDSDVSTLREFSEGHATLRYSELLHGLPAPLELNSKNARIQYEGEAPFAGAMREIRCWTRQNNYQFDLEGVPVCRIDLDKKHIRLLTDDSFDSRLNLELATGPALMIALAARGIYGLHAGAILADQGAIAFIAESGVGKSTLSADGGVDWVQLCDDIMPLEQRMNTTGEGDEFLLHDFPQLKLPNTTSSTRPRGQIKLAALVRLRAQPSQEIQFSRLEKSEALLQIVRHTVAAKLFNKPMMKHHVRFAKRLSKAVPVIELSYPRDLAKLPALKAEILSVVSRCYQ